MSVRSWAMARIGAGRLVPPQGSRLAGVGLIRPLILVAVLGIVAGVYFLRGQLDPGNTGYPTVAALSFFASAGLVVPVPGMAAVCAGGVLLSPLLVALVAGTTGTVGELSAYALGVSGRGAVNRGRLYGRVEGWMRRRGWLVLFLLSVIPNPVFDIAGVIAGALRYPLWCFLWIIWIGTFIKFLVVVYACAYGVEGFLGALGVSVD